MQVNEFLKTLKDSEEKSLIFSIDNDPIPSSYHITEVKDAQFDTVDCGGKTDHWRETIVQLWAGQKPDNKGRAMPISKALSIFETVSAAQPLQEQDTIKFEYRATTNETTSIYSIGGIESQQGQLVVHLGNVPTQCKAAERSKASEGACCSAPSCCA